MPHTMHLRLFAICLALGISFIGEATVMTSAQPGPQTANRLSQTIPVPTHPFLRQPQPLLVPPAAHS